MKAFRKHKVNNLYWSFELKEWVTQNCIPFGSLVIDHEGRDISKELKVINPLHKRRDKLIK
jgi:hypothetical protein